MFMRRDVGKIPYAGNCPSTAASATRDAALGESFSPDQALLVDAEQNVHAMASWLSITLSAVEPSGRRVY